MVFRNFIFWFFIFFYYSSFSQGEWNKWYCGSHVTIDFNSGIPVVLGLQPMVALYTSASVSDSSGNILFYSNGEVVYNQNGFIMPNGSGLMGYEGSQPVLAVNAIGEDSLYYIFTVDQYPSTGMHYSVLDMTLDGGLGDILLSIKNIPVPGASNAAVHLTGTRHQNNRDAWVVTRKWGNDHQYAAYLVTSLGISDPPVLSNSNFLRTTPYGGAEGQMEISLDGTKLICPYDTFEMCSFNRITGKITPLFGFVPQQGLTPPYQPYHAVGFSVDSRFLYVMAIPTYDPPGGPGALYQYDATKTDSAEFMQSEILVSYFSDVTTFPQKFQLGPDNKIYCPEGGNFFIHAINYPSVQGSGCNFQMNAIGLAPGMVAMGCTPSFLQKYKAYIHSYGHCQNSSVQFSGDIWPPADSIHWDFGDPASGILNYSNDSTPFHIYSFSGQYTVELFVRHIDNRTDTSWQTITINESPGPALGPDTTICQGDSATFDAGSCSGCTYQWIDISTGLPVGTGQTFTIGQAGNYEVSVTTTNGCMGRDTVQLTVTPPPSITNDPLLKSICSGESTDIPLTSNVANTDFSWTVIGSSSLVTGFSSGSGDTIDQVLANSGSGPETVTYTITPAVGNCAGDSVQYVVTVTPGDSVMVTIASSADSICNGTSVTFSATPANGGTTPTFQWKVNGISQGSNDSIFTYVPLDGDNITCVLTSSNTICTSNNPATSNPIIMQVSLAPEVFFIPCVDTMTTTNAKPIKLKGGIPLGGTYSGPGVSDGFFYPGIAGTGTHQIIYTYANYALCSEVGYLILDVRSPQLFSCGNDLLDIRDSTIYPTILIGTQCWFASNLNYGTEIPYSTPQRDNCIPEKYSLSSSPLPHPAFYQWDELMNYQDTEQTQGLCPPGWHVPSESDWNQLFTFYQGNAFAGSPLLYSGYSGFDALLPGAGFFNNSWELEGFATLFWSSTSHGRWKAWAHGMNEYNYSVSYYPGYRANALSVRCLLE